MWGKVSGEIGGNDMFGVALNRYDKELYIYKVFDDGSKRRIARLYELNNFVHIDVRGNNFKYIPDLENECDFFSANMVGVDLNVLYSDLLEKGTLYINDDIE